MDNKVMRREEYLYLC